MKAKKKINRNFLSSKFGKDLEIVAKESDLFFKSLDAKDALNCERTHSNPLVELSQFFLMKEMQELDNFIDTTYATSEHKDSLKIVMQDCLATICEKYLLVLNPFPGVIV